MAPAVEEDVVTAASWRMLQWMTHYADLMRLLPTSSGTIYSGCCELFELYFLHIFHHFSGISIAALLQGQTGQVILTTALVLFPQSSMPFQQYVALLLLLSRSREPNRDVLEPLDTTVGKL